ncbi:hypothetical protein SASPL_100803 [Salvia splendens]|uniref:TolB protein n=1 Tax=Salvia splendens TaxID=180675 RepID=A0A8X8YSU7_SALSN|nr:hypothetical protein SASPL_100803 [Salvia splendens]
MMNRDGSGIREVSKLYAFATSWDWKRKGVVYTSAGPDFSSESTKVDIVSINVDDEDLSHNYKTLTKGGANNAFPSPSPDGKWVVENPGGGSFEMLKIHPNGTGLQKVIQSGTGGRTNHPWLSPDGKQIVFTSDYAGVSAEPISNPHHYQPYGEIFVINADGSGLQRLTHNSFEDGTPTWSPKYIGPPTNAEWP